MEPYATIEDLESRWRTLDADEKRRAEVKIADASALIASEFANAGIDMPVINELTEANLKAVTCEMVKRSMASPIDQAPVSANSVTAGPFSESFTFANPSGDMYMTSGEKRRLGLKRQRVGSIAPNIGRDGS